MKNIVTSIQQGTQEENTSLKKFSGRSLQRICPHCQSTNLIVGAGKKPGEESRRCEDCKHFLGYSPVARLQQARKRKQLTECLQVLESQGIQSELALFTLSLAPENGGEG
jgi:transposase-like protein